MELANTNTATGSGSGKVVIRFMTTMETEEDFIVIPDDVVAVYGNQIPQWVKLHLPNGEEFDGHYHSDQGVFCHVKELFEKYADHKCLFVMMSYMGNENFLLNVFKNRTEFPYPEAVGLGSSQDSENGIGLNFYTIVVGQVQSFGKTDVPDYCLGQYGSSLQHAVTYETNSGQSYKGCFSAVEGRLYGLHDALRGQIRSIFDFVMLTYLGDSKFRIGVFGGNRVEIKCFSHVTTVGSASGNDKRDVNEDIVAGMEVVAVAGNGEKDFTVKANSSTIDGRSHGVYIAGSVTPANREWIAGEDVILRTDKGDCTVSLVKAAGRARFSAGWNAFVRTNDLKENATMHFSLEENDTEGLCFNVKID